MDRTKEIELLKQALDEIPYLRTLHFKNGEFSMWRGKVLHALESAYGKESTEYSRFVNAPGKVFIVRTEMGQQEDYHWRLDCYESVIRSLIN